MSATVRDAEFLESENQIERLSSFFRLLSDANRLRILVLLNHHGELHVKALCKQLKQSQPAVSHHLALLRSECLIELRREGKHNFYRLSRERFWTALEEAMLAMKDLDELGLEPAPQVSPVPRKDAAADEPAPDAPAQPVNLGLAALGALAGADERVGQLT